MTSRTATGVAIAIALLTGSAGLAERVQTDAWMRYADPQQRFEFMYPTSFGTPEGGTNSGFGQRVVAVRFPLLVGLGGEAALTNGPVVVDIQALGGLYDAITRELLPDADWQVLAKALPAVTIASFCALLGSADHVTGAPLPPRLEDVARKLDAMRNVSPVVHRCTSDAGVVVFHKEVTFLSGAVSARQHLYGGVRFLDPPYSSFQIVRGSLTAPSAADLDTLERIVRSFVVQGR